jgi:predicted ATPase
VIRSIEIKGLRGIREGQLADLTPLVVLVGPNGSGKSTILEGLLIGASPASNEAIARAVQRHRGVNQGARWLFWKGGEAESLRIVVTSERARRTCELVRSRAQSQQQTVIKFLLEGGERMEMRFAPGNVSDWGGAPAGVFDRIQDVRLVEVHTTDLQLPLHQLFTKTVEQGRREQARAIITDLLPKFTNIEILTEGDTPILELVFQDRSVPAVLCGDGIQSLLRLALELASLPGGLVLLEEPELHQHPGALRQSARAILAAVRRDIQVILTTHSLDFIDSLLSESTVGGHADLDKLSLYRTALKDGRLLATRYSGSEVALARGEIQDDLR